MTQPHHMSKPTDAGMARFTTLLDELSSERDVVKASMFGMPGIKRRGGKAFCGLYGDDMIFKLEGEGHARAHVNPNRYPSSMPFAASRS